MAGSGSAFSYTSAAACGTVMIRQPAFAKDGESRLVIGGEGLDPISG